MGPEELVVAYHEQTKHHFHSFARGPGYLDWSTQPDPFRRYDGAPLHVLPPAPSGRPLEYWELYVPGRVAPSPLTIESLSLFFRYALSLTAWKEAGGARWSLRANPSSGNLHPTEGYAILPAIDGLSAGVYHYAPHEHALELRASIEGPPVPEGFAVALSSIFWREAWKYGERAYRYCQHDVGHALGTMRFAAAALGWRLQLLDGIADAEVARLLGVDRAEDYGDAEREHPELLAWVGATTPPKRVEARALEWFGRANTLSRIHRANWSAVEAVAAAAENPGRAFKEDFEPRRSPPPSGGSFTAEKVILGRRSALGMDGKTSLDKDTFLEMLARTMPGNVPWDAIGWRPHIHLAIFVHRVDGLEPGLYWLDRAGDPRPNLLRSGDFRKTAAQVSCDQDIAGDGAFSLGMIADFFDGISTHGATFYRNLFWEAGLLGQVLYLEAEEAGLGATGIGCYFDDAVHQTFGLTSRDRQSFYHFTVGKPITDPRMS